jgi:hypothetical protein
MNNLSSSVNSFDWRRSKVQELASQGYNQSEISRILQISQPKREKIHALSLAKECYSMKLDLLTNATVVDDAIRFVSSKSKDKPKPSSSNSNQDEKESNEPDYNEYEDQLEEKLEEQTGEMIATTITTNQVF